MAKIINHLLLICSSIVIYEFIQLVNFANIFKSKLKIFKKIFNLFQYKNVSDFRKEKLILKYSKSLLLVSLRIIVIFLLIFVFIITLNLLSNSYLNFIMSIMGAIELSIVFLIYHLIRKKSYAKL